MVIPLGVRIRKKKDSVLVKKMKLGWWLKRKKPLLQFEEGAF